MNKKEVSALKRRLKPDRNAITKIRGCYVTSSGNIRMSFNSPVSGMSNAELEGYLKLFNKTLGGSIGKNLKDIVFSTQQIAKGPEHKLLSTLRDTALKDEKAVSELYQKIANTVAIDSDYLILLAQDTYDIPQRKEDVLEQDMDEYDSDEQFSYIICSICPIKESKISLKYQASELAFRCLAPDQTVSPPLLGFLFPAFDDRSTNLYGALCFIKKPANDYSDFITAIFNTTPFLSAETQRNILNDILVDALGHACSVEVLQSIPRTIAEKEAAYLEAHPVDPFTVSKGDFDEALNANHVDAEKIEVFNRMFNESFGADAELYPGNIFNGSKTEYRTPAVTIRVDSSQNDLIRTHIIGGVKYLLVDIRDGVEVNGVKAELS